MQLAEEYVAQNVNRCYINVSRHFPIIWKVSFFVVVMKKVMTAFKIIITPYKMQIFQQHFVGLFQLRENMC
jgi:hypothetical protein